MSDPHAADRAHMSIGEVLSLLHDDFPDVTISKIRFLESQGLLDPERTPSGYRKFYEADIERLRWILRQQKDNFLPLKVIKDRLAEIGPRGAPAEDLVPAATQVRAASRPATSLPPAPEIFERLQEASAARRAGMASPASRSSGAERAPLDVGPTAVSLTSDELVAASGCNDRTLADLVRFGLIAGRPMGRDTVYDEEALMVARLAASFARFGVEARHLRMYKVAAEREAGFLEQVVLPLMKQRNPSARRQAVENLNELTTLGDSLRGALLRQSLRGYTA